MAMLAHNPDLPHPPIRPDNTADSIPKGDSKRELTWVVGGVLVLGAILLGFWYEATAG